MAAGEKRVILKGVAPKWPAVFQCMNLHPYVHGQYKLDLLVTKKKKRHKLGRGLDLRGIKGRNSGEYVQSTLYTCMKFFRD